MEIGKIIKKAYSKEYAIILEKDGEYYQIFNFNNLRREYVLTSVVGSVWELTIGQENANKEER